VRLSSVSLIFIFQLSWGSVFTEPQISSLKKLYHFNNPSGSSEFLDPSFYVHANGNKNFELELQALVEGLEKPSSENSVACLFPARKKRIEQFLNKKFPNPPCPELDYWRANLKSTHISLLFSGAYSQNPASLFGHTLFRISNREDPKRTSALLSYAVGFLASTGEDGALSRIRKGLTGQYPGYYNLEPFYIKLGLYNNSESRDIWEVDLNFSQTEVDFFIDHLWEISRYSKPYYFIKRNCSFHLLRVVEAIRPDLNLVQNHGFETLPHESVRTLINAGLTNENKRFYMSLKRKMILLLEKMNASQMFQFKQSQKSLQSLDTTVDPLVLDALIYHWQMVNYQNNAKLTESQKKLMDLTLNKRALVPIASDHNQLVSQDVGPLAPYDGHLPQQIKLGVTDKNSSWLSYRHGVHGFNQSSMGFDDFSSIEYLGLKYQVQNNDLQNKQYQILLADIRSFETTETFETKKSWMISTKLNSRSYFLNNLSDYFSAKAGLGFSKKYQSTLLYSLILADAEIGIENKYVHNLRPGLLMGLRSEIGLARMILEAEIYQKETIWKIDLGYNWTRQLAFYVSYQLDLLLNKNSLQFIVESNF